MLQRMSMSETIGSGGISARPESSRGAWFSIASPMAATVIETGTMMRDVRATGAKGGTATSFGALPSMTPENQLSAQPATANAATATATPMPMIRQFPRMLLRSN